MRHALDGELMYYAIRYECLMHCSSGSMTAKWMIFLSQMVLCTAFSYCETIVFRSWV